MSHEANEDASFLTIVYQKRQKKSTKESGIIWGGKNEFQ
jgi:hypothetical protein